MSTYDLYQTYLTVIVGRVVDRSRSDDRGFTDMAGTLVMVATAVVATLAIAAILWAKLREGATGVQTPAPAAP